MRPHVSGLRDRIWYGPGGVESAELAARQGLDLLLSAIGPDVGLGFEGGQRAQIDAHRAAVELAPTVRRAHPSIAFSSRSSTTPSAGFTRPTPN